MIHTPTLVRPFPEHIKHCWNLLVCPSRCWGPTGRPASVSLPRSEYHKGVRSAPCCRHGNAPRCLDKRVERRRVQGGAVDDVVCWATQRMFRCGQHLFCIIEEVSFVQSFCIHLHPSNVRTLCKWTTSEYTRTDISHGSGWHDPMEDRSTVLGGESCTTAWNVSQRSSSSGCGCVSSCVPAAERDSSESLPLQKAIYESNRFPDRGEKPGADLPCDGFH